MEMENVAVLPVPDCAGVISAVLEFSYLVQ